LSKNADISLQNMALNDNIVEKSGIPNSDNNNSKSGSQSNKTNRNNDNEQGKPAGAIIGVQPYLIISSTLLLTMLAAYFIYRIVLKDKIKYLDGGSRIKAEDYYRQLVGKNTNNNNGQMEFIDAGSGSSEAAESQRDEIHDKIEKLRLASKHYSGRS